MAVGCSVVLLVPPPFIASTIVTAATATAAQVDAAGGEKNGITTLPTEASAPVAVAVGGPTAIAVHGDTVACGPNTPATVSATPTANPTATSRSPPFAAALRHAKTSLGAQTPLYKIARSRLVPDTTNTTGPRSMCVTASLAGAATENARGCSLGRIPAVSTAGTVPYSARVERRQLSPFCSGGYTSVRTEPRPPLARPLARPRYSLLIHTSSPLPPRLRLGVLPGVGSVTATVITTTTTVITTTATAAARVFRSTPTVCWVKAGVISGGAHSPEGLGGGLPRGILHSATAHDVDDVGHVFGGGAQLKKKLGWGHQGALLRPLRWMLLPLP